MINKIDHDKLIIELQKPVYTGMNDEEAATRLSADGPTDHWEKVPVSDLMEVVMGIGLYRKIKAKRASDTQADLLIDMLQNPRLGAEIDFGSPVNSAMIVALKTSGDISAAQLETLKSVGRRKLNLGEELLDAGKTIHHLDVARARGRGN